MYDYTLNIFSIVILTSLLAIIYFVKDTVNIRSRLFRMMIITTILMNVLEMLSWAFDGLPGEANRVLNFSSNFLFTALGTTVASLWACYIDYVVHKNYVRIKTKWYYFLPPTIMVILSIINIFNPILFTISLENVYSRLPLLWIQFPMILVIYVFVLIMVARRDHSEDKKVIIGVLVFLSLPLLSVVIQLLFLGVSLIWPSTSVAIILIYIIFQTTTNTKDYLTGLYTRDRAEERIDRYLIQKKPFSVIMIDLDGFKKINDTYGHHYGDQVLTEVAHVIHASFDHKTIVSRYGGDEFIVVTPIATLNELYKKREDIELNKSKSLIKEVNDLGFSFGVAISDVQDTYTIDSIIIEADNNMYADKESILRKKIDM